MRSLPLIALLLFACAARESSPGAAASASQASAAEPQPQEPPAPAELYPTPYTAEQIREATRPGRTYTWRVEVSGQEPIERSVAFSTVDAKGAEIIAGGEAKRVTWEELRRHAEFPRAAVTTHEESVTVPAGTFACVVYVVSNPSASEQSSFFFAKNLPGAPVLYFTDKGGARVMTGTLVRYAAGGG